MAHPCALELQCVVRGSPSTPARAPRVGRLLAGGFRPRLWVTDGPAACYALITTLLFNMRWGSDPVT